MSTYDESSDIYELVEGSCRVCDNIKRMFNEPELEFEAIMDGRGPDIPPCEFHDPLLKWLWDTAFQRYLKEYPGPGLRRAFDKMGLEFHRDQDTPPMFSVIDTKHRPDQTHTILLRKSPEIFQQRFETTLNPLWVDLKLASDWMNRCLVEHGARCSNLWSSHAVQPDWLVDIERHALVRGQGVTNYIAMSYRWGTLAPANKPQPGSWDQLMEPGSFSQLPIWQIPIIRDAVHVVREMGERYLWTDILCIDNTDRSHLAHQLQHMGSIYAAAKLVIIATDGDAMEGLHGLEGCSKSRDLDTCFTLRNGVEVVVQDPPDLSSQNGKHSSEYSRRGWTYQEYFLARRRLVFGKKQIHWSCSCASWHEDQPEVNSLRDEQRSTLSQVPNIISGLPDFQELAAVICEYNDRDLAYPEDALPGIMGLLQNLSPPFHGGLLFDIPRVCFEAGLLWNCGFNYSRLGINRNRGLQRRHHSTQMRFSLPHSQLPSWSWVGWKDKALRLQELEEDFRVFGIKGNFSTLFIEDRKWVTVPITQWYSHDGPKSEAKEPIESIWFTVHSSKDQTDTLPEGWMAERFDHSKHVGADKNAPIPWGVCGKYVYQHVQFPGRYYWRPIPITTYGESHMIPDTKQDQFIACKTQRGWFQVETPGLHDNYDGKFQSGMDVHLQLLDDSNQSCGVLQLPNVGEIEQFKEHPPPNSPSYKDTSLSTNDHVSKIRIELVAICRRMYPMKKTVEETINHFIPYEESYGVLWVEWEEGVAYRRGVGSVTKHGWEQHDLEDVDSILG